MHKVVEKYIIENNLNNEAEVWPLLKYRMTRYITLSKGVEDMEFVSKSYVTLFLFLVISIINLLRVRFSKKTTAYFGAFSRVSISDGIIYDEFVSVEKQQNICTLYHCSNFEKLKILTCFKRGVIFENLLVKLLCLFIKGSSDNKSAPLLSEGFFNLLNQEYGVSKHEILGILLDYESKKVSYKLLLKWLGVLNVEIVSAYTKPAIVSAANELGIITLEYQHGLLAPYHPSYHYTGQELWRSSMLPTRLKLYSRFWEIKMCEANFIQKDAIELEEALPQVSDDVKKQIFTQVGSDKFFIFTGQGLCYSEVSKFVIDVLEKYPDYIFIYRPHPREFQNYYQLSAKVDNVRFKIINRKEHQDTLTLIAASKAHFSIFSSCHFEAVELLGRTYVLDIIENNVMKVTEDKNIIFITSASQFQG